MKNIFPATLTGYLAKLYALCFLGLLGILLSVVYLFETVELLRRAAKMGDIPLNVILSMSLFKLPEVGQIVLPFAVLFSALYCFWILARRQELVILRAAGLSVWQFLGPVVATAMLFGAFHVTVVNPLSALMISRFEVMERNYLGAEEKLVSLSGQGLWLRQGTENGFAVIHAEGVQLPEWRLHHVMALHFDATNAFTHRVDAAQAVLGEGQWEFYDAVWNGVDQPRRMVDYLTLPTNLSVAQIMESFSSAQETPFWALPGYIRTMEATGFDSRELKIHFHTLLAQPLLFAAMVLLAATVSLRHARHQRTSMLMGIGVLMGFIMFFATSFLKALGASDQIPVLLAAWFPPLIALMFGISVIMTTEDG